MQKYFNRLAIRFAPYLAAISRLASCAVGTSLLAFSVLTSACDDPVYESMIYEKIDYEQISCTCPVGRNYKISNEQRREMVDCYRESIGLGPLFDKSGEVNDDKSEEEQEVESNANKDLARSCIASNKTLEDMHHCYREGLGLPPLMIDYNLVAVAEIKAGDMAQHNYYNHLDSDCKETFEVMDECGIEHGMAGENLAKSSYPMNESEARAFEGLVSSSLHHENIINPFHLCMGIGRAGDYDGYKYYAIEFTDCGLSHDLFHWLWQMNLSLRR